MILSSSLKQLRQPRETLSSNGTAWHRTLSATQPTASTRSHQQANGTMTSGSSQLAQIQPREVLSSCETQHTSTPATYAKPTLTNLRMQQQSLQQANRNHDPVIFIEVAQTAKGNVVSKRDCMTPDARCDPANSVNKVPSASEWNYDF